MQRRVLSALGLVLVALSSSAAASDEGARSVAEWLVIDPVAIPRPAFHDEEGHEVELKELLDARVAAATFWPRAGHVHTWPGGQNRTWERRETDEGRLRLGEVDDQIPGGALAAFTITVDRFATVELKVESGHLLRVFLDGSQVAEKVLADAGDDSEGAAETPPGACSADLELVRGTHVILVQSLSDPAAPGAWALAATVVLDDESEAVVTLGTRSDHALRLTDLFDVDAVSEASISADGEHVAVHYRNPVPNADPVERWVDVLRADDGSLVRSFRGLGNLASFGWGPVARPDRFSFVTRDDGKATLWVGDLDTGDTRQVLKAIEDFGSYRWLPDGQSVLYTVTEEAEPKHDTAKRYQGLTDRWSGFRDKSYLYQASIDDGTTRRLTGGIETTSLSDVSADGRTVLFTRRFDSYGEWPYSGAELYELDLATLTPTLLHRVAWGIGAEYSPDGKRILLTGSASLFGDLGTDVEDGQVPNLYDTQAYLMDRESGEIEAITRDFDPAVSSVEWAGSGALIFRAQAGSRTKLFHYDVKRERFQDIEAEVDVVAGLDVAIDGSRLVYRGSGPNRPERVFVADAKAGARSRLIADPGAALLEDLNVGRVEDFDFEATGGQTIVGRVYYPPDFDRAARYPAIVYYYGGTSPVSRSYGGRYPKELWASMGYVVYVLQPSGATGFGQAFSAEHVNNWGKTVTGEIIEGTQKFLAAHPFVDPERVGCIGASYGGFMTMLLTTQTNMFGAAVSHAGISSISSYWGEGWWGYLYSAAATAQAYPWNRPDIYVDQSALFHADEIETPLLLLHGSIDNNVPPGESEQLYTALKVLNKDVEYILVDGERHWILEYDRRTLWTNTIVAYFDWKLKGQAAWWSQLWGD